MIVLHLTSCPIGLRGDLTKWLMEISTGVFVGRVSARVREKIWERVVLLCKSGRAVMVYPAANEQGLNFFVHGDTWEPIDFDGLKLMLRPSVSRSKQGHIPKVGFSDAARYRKVKKLHSTALEESGRSTPTSYIVLDIETTGLNSKTDEIIEIGAIKIENCKKVDVLNMLVNPQKPIPPQITELTGITQAQISASGISTSIAINKMVEFLGKLPIVSHNVDFDNGFISEACLRLGITYNPKTIDTLTLARSAIKGLPNYKLQTLAKYLLIPHDNPHRSMNDCETTWQLYEKLINLQQGK